MAALETLSGFVTAPGAVLTALTMAAGDSLTVRNFPDGKNAYLLGTFPINQAAGYISIRSPKLHDNVLGINLRVPLGHAVNLLPQGIGQKLYAQDQLTISLSGSAVAGTIEMGNAMLFYEDLPGSNGRLFTWDDIKTRIKEMVSVDILPTNAGTGGYGPSFALNSTIDLLKANTDYALIGAISDTVNTVIGIRGSDTGNIRIGIPIDFNKAWYSAEYLKNLSQDTGLPTIPVFDSANKAGIFIDITGSDVAAAPNCSLIFAEL